MIYTVTFELSGYHYIDIEADSKEDAMDSATEIFSMTDFGSLVDVDGTISSVEDEDGYDHDDDQKARAAPGVQRGELLRVLHGQRLAALKAEDRLVLGTVVHEHAVDLLHARDHLGDGIQALV